MKTANELYLEFEAATRAYLDKVAALNQSEMNTVPFEGSWTAAQVTEHLCKSDYGMVQTLNGPVQPTNRQPDEMVNKLESIFLDFSTKFTSPDFIIPENKTYDKDDLLTRFKAGREQFGKAIQSLDLTPTCTLPILGDPTRLELITFVIVHTRRHTNQVNKICQKLVTA